MNRLSSLLASLIVFIMVNLTGTSLQAQTVANAEELPPNAHFYRVWDCKSANVVSLGWAVNSEDCSMARYDGVTSALEVLKKHLSDNKGPDFKYTILKQTKGKDLYRAFLRRKVWDIYDFVIVYN